MKCIMVIQISEGFGFRPSCVILPFSFSRSLSLGWVYFFPHSTHTYVRVRLYVYLDLDVTHDKIYTKPFWYLVPGNPRLRICRYVGFLKLESLALRLPLSVSGCPFNKQKKSKSSFTSQLFFPLSSIKS